MMTVTDLLRLTDRFLAVSGLRETQVSHRVFGDSKKIAALRAGADLVTARFNAAVEWYADNWPDGHEWPDGIARPEQVGDMPAPTLAQVQP